MEPNQPTNMFKAVRNLLILKNLRILRCLGWTCNKTTVPLRETSRTPFLQSSRISEERKEQQGDEYTWVKQYKTLLSLQICEWSYVLGCFSLLGPSSTSSTSEIVINSNFANKSISLNLRGAHRKRPTVPCE